MIDIVELVIDEESVKDGVDAISLVEHPAIEENFVALSKHEVEFKAIDNEKRIVVGLALIPEKLIYRRNKESEYYITFSKETVRKASELYLKRLKNNNATLEHEIKTDGVSVIESWIVEDLEKDKSALYGLNASIGSWCVTMKIDNDKVWQDVKDGTYLGLSIEGIFSNRESQEDLKANKQLDAIRNIIRENESKVL